MSDENYLKEVREHYENYPYPPTNPDDEFTRLYMPITESFDRLNHYAFEGKRNFTKNFRVLVAGGGTGDAIIALAEQLRGTEAELIYIDMSEASMRIAQQRAANRHLTNITWIRDSLLNLPKLNVGTFDYINCSGVLHHLADPDLGLGVLASCLKDDGAMCIMVYATYGRTAVYQMQEALRIVNHGEPNIHTRVANTKAILKFLPHTNWMHFSPPQIIAEAQQSDIGIYDLLLHAQDRSYTVRELYEFVGKQGLSVLRFFSDDRTFGNRLYDPTYYMKDVELEEKVQAMPLVEQQSLAELLNGHIIKHTVYLARNARNTPVPTDMDLIPLYSFDVIGEESSIINAINNAGPIVQVKQTATGLNIAFVNSPHLGSIASLIDGKRSLREIFRKIMDTSKNGSVNFQTLLAEFTPFYEALHNFDWIFLRYPCSSSTFSYNELQSRVKPA